MQMTLAALLAVAGALAFYLAAPRQQLLAQPIPGWAGIGAGVALIAAAWWLRTDELAWHTHFFTLLTLLMLAWGLIPYVAVWLRHGRGR